MTTQISLSGVAKTFDTASGPVNALENIDLNIEKGEIFAVIGYSGAGKSTLIRLINGLEKASSGKVAVDGVDITNFSERQLRPVRANIGMIFQQFNLMMAKNVYDNVAYPLKLAGWSKEKIQARVTELLNFVGLVSKAWVYPSELSGGQKQRVGIARAMATNPSVLLADESTSALDPETTQDVLSLLRRINEVLGVTIVVITHEMEVVRSIADRVAVLDSGNLIEQGSVSEIFEHPRTQTTTRFVSTIMRRTPEADELERLRSENPDAELVSVQSVDPEKFGAALARLSDEGIEFSIVQGGVVPVKARSIGSFTLALRGEQGTVRVARKYLENLSWCGPDDLPHEKVVNTKPEVRA